MKYGCQSMVGKLETVIIKHARDAFVSQEYLNENWEKFKYTSCPDYEKAVKEYETFEKILKEHVANVYYLPCDEDAGIDSIYAFDSCKITSKGAIMLNFGKKERRGEVQATKKFLQELGIPILGEITGNGTIEGGEVAWLDERILAVGRSYRTNDEGIRQFRELTKDLVDEFIVVDLPHANGPDECLHLTSIISPVDKDLAVVYSKLMPVTFRQLLIERGIQLIEVPDDEYETLGCNVLALAPRKCLMLAGNPKTKAMLEEAGATVYEYEGEEISLKGTGGATCMTLTVTRI